MAGEFDILETDGQGRAVLWKCKQCDAEIRGNKPRGHVCVSPITPHPGHPINQIRAGTTPASSRSQSPFPPPGTPFSPSPAGLPFNIFQHPPPPIQPPVQQASWAQWQALQEQRYREQQEFMRQQQDLIRQQQEQQRKDMMEFQARTFEMMKEDNDFKKKMIEAIGKEKKEEVKKTKCPVWDKEESIEKYIPRLKIWDKMGKHKGKYLELLASLQSSGKKKEKDKIELEVQKGDIDPESDNVIQQIIEKLENWFAKPRMEKGASSWRNLRDMRRGIN